MPSGAGLRARVCAPVLPAANLTEREPGKATARAEAPGTTTTTGSAQRQMGLGKHWETQLAGLQLHGTELEASGFEQQ